MDKLGQAYEVLGVPPEIPTRDLRRHYRELVRRWHPDQFAGNQEEQRVADETLRSINDAYQLVIRQRADADESAESEPADPQVPPASPGPSPSPRDEAAAEDGPPEQNRSSAVWVLGLLGGALLLGGVWWIGFRSPESRGPSEAVIKPAVTTNQPVRPKRALAAYVVVAVDEVMPAIWHNGQRVPDDKCQLLGDDFGATLERVNITVNEDDWLVFNVASNPVRWGGSVFFGAAGMITEKAASFSSTTKDGRWSYEERPDALRAFIEQREAPGLPVRPPTVEWGKGRVHMGNLTSGTWGGDPIWGSSHSTWIKFVARSLTNSAALPPTKD
ncbi:MAG TPA: J domain-containing protein [Candidatus Limnocylindria bacterium]|nr:J domain-containing protein [Candidatus Limnocylindria bacterium]